MYFGDNGAFDFKERYSVFQWFGLAKSAHGGSILGSIRFFTIAPAASENGTHLKRCLKWLKNNHPESVI